MRSTFSKLLILLLLPMTAHSLESRVLSVDGRFEGAPSQRTPLGSVWKLFAYAYLSEKGLAEPRYTCRGNDPEEIFCCAKNQTIERDTALAKSCAPYFKFDRVGIRENEWRMFWSAHQAPPWLADLSKLKPETRVAVDELLQSLIELRSLKTFDAIEAASARTVIDGTAAGSAGIWGTSLRVKTFTWRDPALGSETAVDKLGFAGGFAGWLADGSAIWVSQAGHGRDAFQSELRNLVDSHVARDTGCVRVRYFDRYKLNSLPSTLSGSVRLKFTNGNSLSFIGDGSLRTEGGRISAQITENEYIGRVLDREVASSPIDAARAFAVLARTFLHQNARVVGSCLEIADSSHLQRVSPSAASSMSLAIARWSDGLTLAGVSRVRYHSTLSSENRLSWTEAVKLARSGYSMTEILRSAYPTSSLKYGASRAVACTPVPLVAKWITTQSRSWRQSLNSVEGFEAPADLKVCRQTDRISSDLLRDEIFVPSMIRGRDDEVSVLHEYLHVGFKSHPRGRDELFIERQARALLEDK